ncbi:MAG: TerC family protein [Candidatus Hydrogenedentes bacterium]|nr:TerC family protein [Candidatus Hydrogenedentota bacterium]
MTVEGLFTVENLIAFVTLTALEIVLGIDNIVMVAILTGKLPQEQQAKARQIGLALAMGMRILLLLTLSWIMGLTKPFVTLWGFGISGRDLILLIGGLFLIGKGTVEIHDKIEGGAHEAGKAKLASYGMVLAQIMLLDLVFSLDSVITAVGMAQNVIVMIAAIIVAVIVMMVFAGTVSAFITRHPTLKILALSFLILIGVMLTVEGLHQHVSKGYIYFAMAFSICVETLNIRMRTKAQTQAH